MIAIYYEGKEMHDPPWDDSAQCVVDNESKFLDDFGRYMSLAGRKCAHLTP